jgi:hypothetical protein
MKLEDQELSTRENNNILSEMVEELIDTLPSNLWNQS